MSVESFIAGLVGRNRPSGLGGLVESLRAGVVLVTLLAANAANAIVDRVVAPFTLGPREDLELKGHGEVIVQPLIG